MPVLQALGFILGRQRSELQLCWYLWSNTADSLEEAVGGSWS